MSLVAGWPAAASWAILACTPCMSGPGVKVALRLRPYFLLTAAIISLKAGAPPKLVADQVALTLDSFLAPSISWSRADGALALGLDAGGAGEEVGVVPPQAARSRARAAAAATLSLALSTRERELKNACIRASF